MNCQPCKDQHHANCVDIDPTTGRLHEGRLYASCVCQHNTSQAGEPATGPVGE